MPTLNSQLSGDDTVLFAMPGSQFVTKVVAALDHAQVPYRVVITGLTKLKTDLEPPHTVPQMRWKGELLVDSAVIMEKLDEAGANFYPKDPAAKAEVQQLEQWIGKDYNAHALYFGWVDEEGFSLAMDKVSLRLMPGWMPACLARPILNCAAIGSARKQMQEKSSKILGFPDGPQQNEQFRASLIAGTQKFEAMLKTDTQEWLCETPSPSAVDFTLYGVIEKLVGDSGDAHMGACTPWLFEKAGAPRLKAWHARMAANYPVVCFGKFKEVKVWTKH